MSQCKLYVGGLVGWKPPGQVKYRAAYAANKVVFLLMDKHRVSNAFLDVGICKHVCKRMQIIPLFTTSFLALGFGFLSHIF